MTIARSAVLVVLAFLVACAFAGGAAAQTPVPTSKDAPEPQAVEPQVGTPAPAQPGATTPTVEPVPVPTTVAPATAGGAPAAGPATAGGAPAAQASGDSGGVAWETIAIIALGALLLVVLIVLLLWRVRGWDPRWLQRWRHAASEAGWRLSLGWAEFRDFVRLGR